MFRPVAKTGLSARHQIKLLIQQLHVYTAAPTQRRNCAAPRVTKIDGVDQMSVQTGTVEAFSRVQSVASEIIGSAACNLTGEGEHEAHGVRSTSLTTGEATRVAACVGILPPDLRQGMAPRSDTTGQVTSPTL